MNSSSKIEHTKSPAQLLSRKRSHNEEKSKSKISLITKTAKQSITMDSQQQVLEATEYDEYPHGCKHNREIMMQQGTAVSSTRSSLPTSASSELASFRELAGITSGSSNRRLVHLEDEDDSSTPASKSYARKSYSKRRPNSWRDRKWIGKSRTFVVGMGNTSGIGMSPTAARLLQDFSD